MPPPGPSDNTFDDILQLAFRLSRALARWHAADGGDGELSVLQSRALRYIGERDGASMTALAREFQIGLPSATALADRLFRAGLLSRSEDASDRRVTRVRLTPAGSERLRALREYEAAAFRAALGRMPVYDRQSLVRLLRDLVANVEASA